MYQSCVSDGSTASVTAHMYRSLNNPFLIPVPFKITRFVASFQSWTASTARFCQFAKWRNAAARGGAVQLTRNALRLVPLRRSHGSTERMQRIPPRNFIEFGDRTNREHRIKRLSSSIASYYLHVCCSCTKVGHEHANATFPCIRCTWEVRTSFGELVKKFNFFSVALCRRQLGASPPFRTAFTDAYMG